MTRPRILLADDHLMLLDALKGLLEPAYSVVGLVREGRALLKAADRLRKRVPDPQIWLVHVTLGYLHRFGGHGLRGRP